MTLMITRKKSWVSKSCKIAQYNHGMDLQPLYYSNIDVCFEGIQQCNEKRLELFLGAPVDRVLQLQKPLPMKAHFNQEFIPH